MVRGEEPARAIIEKCGGIEATARIVGRHRSAVNRWLRPRGRHGGTGGRIPMQHAEKLLRAVPALTEADFFAALPADVDVSR